ncbi:MAG: site-2 protease family protein, partial [Deltaproteobacteria bacterium]|nr:site-2 protease family protein [Deltaproteobacteria bacterium]
KLFRVFGIQISIDYSWFIVFILFAWSLSYGYFPFKYPGLGTGTYIVMGVVSALLLFACVLVHELSHSVTANRLGLDIHEITLFIFGGVAQLTKEPEDAKAELKIAIAGPIASAVLAAVFGVLAAFIRGTPYTTLYAILAYLSFINIVLLVFNMIPGFPLDGGRVLRALWWVKTGDLNRSTKVASSIGKGFALFLIILGFFQILMGNFIGGIWAVLIGFFVQQAAESGYQQVVIKKALEGLKVRDVMSTGVVSVSGASTLAEVVDKYFFKHHFVSYPVTSNGRVEGLLSLNSVRAVERERWETTLVRDVMQSLGPEDTLSPGDDASEALNKMITGGAGRFPVLDDGRLVGIVSRRDIMKMLEFKSGLRR